MALRLLRNSWMFLFCGSIATFALFGIVHDVSMDIASAYWGPVDAQVLAIEDQPKGAVLRYQYVVDTVQYRGDKLAFFSEGSIPDKLFIVDHYHIGDRIKVFVNGNNPSESVALRRPFHPKYIWTYLCIFGTCILVGWVCLWRQAKSGKERQNINPTA